MKTLKITCNENNLDDVLMELKRLNIDEYDLPLDDLRKLFLDYNDIKGITVNYDNKRKSYYASVYFHNSATDTDESLSVINLDKLKMIDSFKFFN